MLDRQLTARARGESGESLIEILLAVVIIALSVGALLGALVTSIAGSAEHRSLANLDTVLKSNAESAKYQIELQPSATAWFTDCAAVTGSSYNGSTLSFSVPAGYSVQLAGIRYWNSASHQFDPATVDSSACQSSSSDRSGYQLLTFQATAPSGVSETLGIAVRKPA